MKNERLQALKILIELVENQTPLTHAFNKDHSPLTKAICFGVCRYYYRLQAIVSLLVKKPPPTDITIILIMGLYQLIYLDKPEYVTVKETVELLDKIKKSWAKGLVNAVLRGFCRDKVNLLEKLAQNKQVDFTYNHPSWFIKQVKNDWPEAWQSILEGNDQHPPLSLRVNQQVISRDDYLLMLKDKEMLASPHTLSNVGLTLDKPCDVADLPEFSKGYVSVQDEAAQLAITLLALKPGLRILDACCAPGGKTCHILEAEPALQECVALDIDERRLARVSENLQRLNLKATLVQADALIPSSWWDGEKFDRILLDAPCSATGVIRRHPDIKLLRTIDDIKSVIKLQANLLTSLWPLLKPGGWLVYATCSIIKDENEKQIANFLSKHNDASYCPDALMLNNTTYGWQLFPSQENWDGFFYSVLQKVE